MFNEAEDIIEKTDELATLEISYTRKTPKHKPLPKNLLRYQVILDIGEEDQLCNCCGNVLHKMGEMSVKISTSSPKM